MSHYGVVMRVYLPEADVCSRYLVEIIIVFLNYSKFIPSGFQYKN